MSTTFLVLLVRLVCCAAMPSLVSFSSKSPQTTSPSAEADTLDVLVDRGVAGFDAAVHGITTSIAQSWAPGTEGVVYSPWSPSPTRKHPRHDCNISRKFLGTVYRERHLCGTLCRCVHLPCGVLHAFPYRAPSFPCVQVAFVCLRPSSLSRITAPQAQGHLWLKGVRRARHVDEAPIGPQPTFVRTGATS